MRRGVGWAIGLGAVVAIASTFKRGPQPTLKAAMKAMLRTRESSADLAERVQDVYAEAQAEYAAESLGRDDA